jgi:hypothetical protein
MCHPFEAQLLKKSLSFSSCAFLFVPFQKKCQDSQKRPPGFIQVAPLQEKCQDSQKVHPKKGTPGGVLIVNLKRGY